MGALAFSWRPHSGRVLGGAALTHFASVSAQIIADVEAAVATRAKPSAAWFGYTATALANSLGEWPNDRLNAALNALSDS